ncbi:MAG TPA: Smr/MutS family protein [Terriglobia bacterium]|nr:Smr/MutS family protein [Terriglobia bacterium]
MNRPFTILEEWVKQGRIHLAAEPTLVPVELPAEEFPRDLPDDQLFAFAMKDVKSLGWSAVPLHPRPPMEIQPQDDEQQALRALEEFVLKGNVKIEQTAEYIEGSVHPHGRLYLDDLRSGRFSVQAHLDLHGLNLQEARYILDEFLLESVRAGFSCVRVIHGRGRHSHMHHPVLKENVQRWLCTRRMSRHVIAYTSARRCDGGGGAVYVLLRK